MAMKSENFIMNKEDEKLAEISDFVKILDEAKENNFYGDIKWPSNFPKETEDINNIVGQIEEQLKKNNKQFSRYPTDYMHALICQHITDNKFERGEQNDLVTLNEEVWKVHRIFDDFSGFIDEAESEEDYTVKRGIRELLSFYNFDTKPTKSNDDNGKKHKVPKIFLGVLYFNEKKKQMVLAHKGIEASFKSLFSANNQLSNSFDGILQNKIIPQLYCCYEITKEANRIAKEENCFLSFTGFSNGAWLAEHSVYYSHKDFNNEMTKAVLFESPGMGKTEESEESGIVNEDNDFSLKYLNIVNYLTAPCFTNTCNQHVGQVFRIFVDDSAYKKINNLDEQVAKLKEIPILGKIIGWIHENNAQFFINGLVSMFCHGHLKLIVDQFDAVSGKPLKCEKVKKWPVMKFKFNNDSGNYVNTQLEELSKRLTEGAVQLVPLPDFIKTPCSKVLGSITSKLVTKSVEYFRPGIHLLLNVLIDFYNGRLDLKQFENPSFYKSLEERNESDKSSKYGDEIPKFSKFSYKYEKKYDTEETIRNEKILIIANKNVHWCLEKLYRISKIDAKIINANISNSI